MKNVQVKICGITRAADARAAAAAGADAIGLVFAKASPRFISPASAARIAKAAGARIAKAGVFVDAPLREVLRIAQSCRLDSLQMHGKESPAYCKSLRSKFGGSIVKAFRVSKLADIKKIPRYDDAVDAILLDAYVRGVSGGTGRALNWKLAVQAKRFKIPLILSGGLTPKNVAQAIRRVQPRAVDVSSGVEKSPGLKDPEKIRRFVRRAKAAFR
ncbi:MAG: phosphoribosylanthranilate isomerase [Candidatus Omnitrophica bacterium]|nr:phosphoribosylanthranilate isomerase [Candidatus Omnitrophota bacterium]